ncbi:DnaJ-like cysteine-rich domain-containing protein [Paenibacillus chitinolyticus]|uniref:hypothetical protein n=1 Tax=Paenibacillus chitinolyticus TaxID=79263 RepID=UPI00295EFEA9|nr:hypothetical protein [Paenibacillus chitinolyticus]
MQPKYEQIDLFEYLELHEASRSAEIKREAAEVEKNSVLSQILAYKNRLKDLSSRLTLSNLFGLLRWINIYTVTLSFGGSEGGAWYYRKFMCEQSLQTWFWNAESLRLKLQRQYSSLSWGSMAEDRAAQEIVVLIETKKAAKQYLPKPAYHPDQVRVFPSHTHTPLVPIKLTPKQERKRNRIPFRTLGYQTFAPRKRANKWLAAAGITVSCERCGGTGHTPFKHVQNGICFQCHGNGSHIRQS